MLFDLANGEEQDRIRLAKDSSNNLVMSIYDASGGLRQFVSNSPIGYIVRETWHHVAFTLNSGTFQMYLDAAPVMATASGNGTGVVTNVGRTLFLGSDFQGFVTQGAVFDDLVVSGTVMTSDAINRLVSSPNRFMGVSLTRQNRGGAVTSETPGTQSSVYHGLPFVPGSIVITPRGNGTIYLSAPSDSTRFYVTASAGSLGFDWQASA